MSDKLLPCPFCSGKAIMRERFINGSANKKHYRLECVECHASLLNWSKNTSKAVAAWNRRAQPENKPLTLDELRQMDGEPIWVVTLDGTDEPRWEIVVSAGKCGIDLICVLNGVETSDYADFDLYNDTWLAYRSEPKEEV